jgi:hypothetical protein
VDNRILVELIHGSRDAILEFPLGYDTDMSQDGAGLDEVEARAMLGSEGEFEAARGFIGEPGF